MGGGATKPAVKPGIAEKPQWDNAGQYQHDPRDPEVRHLWDRDADPDNDAGVLETSRRAPAPQQAAQPPADTKAKAADPAPKITQFVHIGNRVSNRPFDKVQDPENSLPAAQSRKKKAAAAPIRAQTITDRVLFRAPDGRDLGPEIEQDRPDVYYSPTLQPMQVDQGDPFNKRPLPTPRRGADISHFSELEAAEEKRKRRAWLQAVNIDAMDKDRVGYQQQLEPLPYMTAKHSRVPREAFMASGSGLDELGRDDETYNNLTGKLAGGERLNLQRIINEF